MQYAKAIVDVPVFESTIDHTHTASVKETAEHFELSKATASVVAPPSLAAVAPVEVAPIVASPIVVATTPIAPVALAHADSPVLIAGQLSEIEAKIATVLELEAEELLHSAKERSRHDAAIAEKDEQIARVVRELSEKSQAIIECEARLGELQRTLIDNELNRQVVLMETNHNKQRFKGAERLIDKKSQQFADLEQHSSRLLKQCNSLQSENSQYETDMEELEKTLRELSMEGKAYKYQVLALTCQSDATIEKLKQEAALDEIEKERLRSLIDKAQHHNAVLISDNAKLMDLLREHEIRFAAQTRLLDTAVMRTNSTPVQVMQSSIIDLLGGSSAAVAEYKRRSCESMNLKELILVFTELSRDA